MKDENCIFCKLANGDIPTNTVYEDEEFRVSPGCESGNKRPCAHPSKAALRKSV